MGFGCKWFWWLDLLGWYLLVLWFGLFGEWFVCWEIWWRLWLILVKRGLILFWFWKLVLKRCKLCWLCLIGCSIGLMNLLIFVCVFLLWLVMILEFFWFDCGCVWSFCRMVKLRSVVWLIWKLLISNWVKFLFIWRVDLVWSCLYGLILLVCCSWFVISMWILVGGWCWRLCLVLLF